MAYVATYLNFMGQTEEAFKFYAKAFGTEDTLNITKFSDVPYGPDLPELEKNLVMNAQLKIVGGHLIMGTDMLESMGHKTRIGNNTTISLNLDSRQDADRLFALLSESSTEKAEMQEMPFGYWGTALDRFGIRWMLNVVA